MKKFLISLSLLLPALLVVLISGELFIESLPNQYKSKNEYMLNNGSNVETLILGSSHTYYGINPEYLDGNAYNLANPGQNYRYDYYLLSHYADKYERLKTVIIPVSYHSFFQRPYETGNEEDKHLILCYHLYMNCPYGKYRFKYNWELCFPIIFRGKIKAWLTKSTRDCSTLGWSTDFKLRNKKMNEEEKTGKKHAIIHTIDDWTSMNENVNNLIIILKFCEERSIRAVLVTPPVWHSYYDNIDVKQFNKMNLIIDSLKRNYIFEYYDYFKDPHFNAEDFFDSNHLSDVGATKFTKILNENIH